jgi:RHS repeat-associated protein
MECRDRLPVRCSRPAHGDFAAGIQNRVHSRRERQAGIHQHRHTGRHDRNIDGFSGIDPLEHTNTTSGETRSLLGGLDISTLSGADWQLVNQLGTAAAVTIQTGNIAGLAEYSDFGVSATTSGWNPLTGYTGELADPTAGLDPFYRRAYDPFTANWTQADPYRGLIDEPQTLNRYAYVLNNPAALWDYAGFSADAADHYGSEAHSYFDSQHKAPKKKSKAR